MFRFCVCHFFIARGLKPTSRDFGPFDMGGWWLQLVLTYCSGSCQSKTLSFAKMHCPPWPLMIFSKSRAVCRHAMLYIHTTFYASHPAMNNVFWCPQRAGNQEMLLSFQPYHYPLLHWGDLGGWIVFGQRHSGFWLVRIALTHLPHVQTSVWCCISLVDFWMLLLHCSVYRVN